MWSSSPTETPPVVMIRSLASAASRSAAMVVFAVVGHDAQVVHFAAQAVQQSPHEEAVGVIDRAGLHRVGRDLAGHHQLIAGGKHGHARLASDPQLVKADAGREAERGRREALALLQHDIAGGHILARAADPLAGCRNDRDAHRAQAASLRRGGGVFLHHDGISALGNLRAGEDARRGAGFERRAHGASGNALGHLEHGARGCAIRCTHRIAVHRAVVARRHGQARDEVFRKHAAVCVEGDDTFVGERRPGLGQQLRDRLVERHQRGPRGGRGERNGSVSHGVPGCTRSARHWRSATARWPRRH
jgi:hypothetical protein